MNGGTGTRVWRESPSIRRVETGRRGESLSRGACHGTAVGSRWALDELLLPWKHMTQHRLDVLAEMARLELLHEQTKVRSAQAPLTTRGTRCVRRGARFADANSGR